MGRPLATAGFLVFAAGVLRAERRYSLPSMNDPMELHHFVGEAMLAMAWWGLAQLLGVGFVFTIALLVTMMFQKLRHPPRRGYAWAVAKGVPGDPSELPQPRRFEQVQVPVDARGTMCCAWIIEGDRADGPVILYTPGWGDAKIKVLERLHAMAPFASSIIAWDPPGHGDSPGACWLGSREPGMIRHIAQHTVPADRRVLLWGHSLGGGAAVVAAAQTERVVAAVAEAPYRVPATPAQRVMSQAGLPWRIVGPLTYWLLGLRTGAGPRWAGFDRVLHAARVAVPLLVVHGDQDGICPLEDGAAIASAAPRGELLTVPGGRHNDLWVPELGTAERVRKWLEDVVVGPIARQAGPAPIAGDILCEHGPSTEIPG
jgi:pimeloyl-ACP methyl ester carboxylesterase